MKTLVVYFVAASASILFSSSAFAHKGMTFQGYLKDANGQVVTSSGVTITSRLVSPNDCVLLEETHSNVTLTSGFFTVVLGSGTRTGADKSLALKDVFSNSAARTGYDTLNGANGNCNYTPTSNDARKVALSFAIGADSIDASFNIRANAYAVWSESSEDSSKLGGKAATDFIQTSANVTQSRLESFLTSLTSTSGSSVKWDGSNFVAYDPASGAGLSNIPGTAVTSLPWSKLTSIPAPLATIGGLSCANGQILKVSGGNWTCAAAVGGGTVTDVTSANSYITIATSTSTPALTLHVGTSANTVAAGDDARFGDALKINGATVDATGLSSGNILQYDGTKWNAVAPPASSPLATKGDIYTFSSANARLAVGADGKVLKADSSQTTGLAWGDAVATDLVSLASTGIVQRNASASYSTVNVVAPLSYSSGTLGAVVGTASGTLAAGDDSRFATIANKVSKTGDTMTGTLNLPVDGLVAGTTQFVLAGGNVGIGTSSPGQKLHLAGTSGNTLRIVDGNQGAGKILTSDASGVASWQSASSGLTHFTESVSSTAPNDTILAVRLLATNAAADVDAVFSSKGGGALTGQLADGTDTGGDKRGPRAVDWQMFRSTSTQVASGPYSVVGGGQQNTASNAMAAVLGGMQNTAGEVMTVVVGGQQNSVSSFGGAIVGGTSNSISVGITGFIGGGASNTMTGQSAFIGAGSGNSASAYEAAVVGGNGNSATAHVAFVGGGQSNIASESYATVAGGYTNTASGEFSTVAGGSNNVGSGDFSFAAGGYNTADGENAIALGRGLRAPAQGQVALGYYNAVSGTETAGSWVATDPLLSVGNGSSLTPSTALQILKNGNVGLGTTGPRAALDVNGTILGKPGVSNGTSTVDFSTGNLQYTASNCGAFNLNNLKDGGSYMFAVQGTTSATCSFSAFSDAGTTALTVHMPPDHAATTAAKHTIYNLAVMGTHVYVAWTPGY